MTSLKHALAALALLLAAVLPARAQQEEKGKALREAVRTYTEENILPVLREERLAFDRQLSAAEKATIERVRAQMKAHHEEGRALRQEVRAQHQQGQAPSEEMHERMEAHRDRQEAIMAPLHQIAQAHESALKGLKTKHQSSIERWKTDLKALKSEHRPNGHGGERPHPAHGQRPEGGPKHGHGGGHGGGHGHALKAFKPVGFLLFDPNGQGPDALEPMDDDDRASIFPNPAAGRQTVSFSTSSAGPVKVELLNQQGEVLRELANGTFEAGGHELEADAAGLRPGVYFYRITTAQGSTTQRWVKQ
jgi:hypothetical protein